MTVLGLLVLLGFPESAHAYIDPATGSMVIQLLISIVVGVGVAAKAYWTTLTGWFGRRPKHSDAPGSGDSRIND